MAFDLGFPQSPDLVNKKMLLYLSVVEIDAINLHPISKRSVCPHGQCCSVLRTMNAFSYSTQNF